MPPSSASRTERIYAVLSGDDAEDRSCTAIPDSACTNLPRNFLLNVANGTCTKLAEQLASPSLVLPWLMATVGAPAGFAGFLMPLKQAGGLLPQMAVAGTIRGVAVRKWFWVGAGAAQAVLLALIVLLGLSLAGLGLSGSGAGLTVVVLFAAFATASGVGSVAFQDVTGKTVPKGLRGRMLSQRASIGGGLTLVAALLMTSLIGKDASADVGMTPVLALIAVAAVLWAAAALLFALIAEDPGATEGGRNIIREFAAGIGLWRKVPGFRRYIWARSALIVIEISTPFFALHGREAGGSGFGDLGLFVLGVGIANVVSSPVWGKLSDRSSRQVMRYACLFAAAAVIAALSIEALLEGQPAVFAYVAVFVMIGLAEAGVRTGRKTYLVDAAPADDRPLYVAFSNTLVGGLALPIGAIGLIGQTYGASAVLAAVLAATVLAYLLVTAMPEAEDMTA